MQRLLLHQILVHEMSAFEACRRKIFYPLLIAIKQTVLKTIKHVCYDNDDTVPSFAQNGCNVSK